MLTNRNVRVVSLFPSSSPDGLSAAADLHACCALRAERASRYARLILTIIREHRYCEIESVRRTRHFPFQSIGPASC